MKILARRLSEDLLKRTSIEHQTQVKSCIDYIYQGEIFQANLSRLWRFKVDEELTDVDIYRKLRKKIQPHFQE